MKDVVEQEHIVGSFRDPSGFIFKGDGLIYRQINRIYKDDFEHLINSGLYEKLVALGMLIPHEEVGLENRATDLAYKVIKPQTIPFISYPYEWCLGQLKDAGLLTLDIQRIALEYGMTLKDCSAYNVQFIGYKPIFIDTLSFERYKEGEPWVAYRQFCQHFYIPLRLMQEVDARLNKMMRLFIDGIPVDLANNILPLSKKMNIGSLMHIYLHAKMQMQKCTGRNIGKYKNKKLRKRAFIGLLDSLQSSIKNADYRVRTSDIAGYYEDNTYTQDALREKMSIFNDFIGIVKPATMWDIGANTGVFTKIAGKKGIYTVSFDIDYLCTEIAYKGGKEEKNIFILPLVMDINNPSPSIGWGNFERLALSERSPVDLISVLALIHHLAIGNNVPFGMVAQYLSKLSKNLIIEFVPKEDAMVQEMLSFRKDIFNEYCAGCFEEAFGMYYNIEKKIPIRESGRIMYLMKGGRQ